MDSRYSMAYLQAMGIQVWRRRQLPATVLNPPFESSMMSQSEPVAAESTTQPSTQPPTIAEQWQRLIAEVDQCTACPLHATRTRAVFGVGHRQAECMVIGEAPGADEDRLGEPFVGRAGRLLDPMLKAIGLSREQVFIANILKSRPPDNRDPRPEEIQACWPYLLRQIELVQPRIFLIMGRVAAQTLLETQTAVGKLRGTVHRFQGRPLIVTYHPAYLLRAPLQKAKAWQDLQLARRSLATAIAAEKSSP